MGFGSFDDPKPSSSSITCSEGVKSKDPTKLNTLQDLFSADKLKSYLDATLDLKKSGLSATPLQLPLISASLPLKRLADFKPEAQARQDTQKPKKRFSLEPESLLLDSTSQ